MEGTEEELREAHGRDEFTDAERAVHGEAGSDQPDDGDEDAGQGQDRPVVPGPAAGGAQCGREGVPAGAAVPVHGRRFGADALEHAQAGDQVGGDSRGVRGLFLFGLAAPFEGAADEVSEPQQGRYPEQDEQAEGYRYAQQGHGADGESGDGGDPVRQGGDHGAHPGRVAGGHGGERAGQSAGVGAAARVEDPGAEFGADAVRGQFAGAVGDAGRGAVAGGQHEEEHGEDEQPAQECRSGSGGDGPVDDDADDDGDHRLAGLVGRSEERGGGDPAPLRGDRAPEDGTSGWAGVEHAGPPEVGLGEATLMFDPPHRVRFPRRTDCPAVQAR